MSRRTVAVAAMTALLVLGTATAARSGSTVFRSTGTGPLAIAQWTTLPEGQTGEPGVVYTNVIVEAGDLVLSEGGDRSRDTFVSFNETNFTVDDEGNTETVSLTVGDSIGPVTLAFDQRLRWASAQATLELTRCDPVTVCGPAGTADITVSWVGAGDLGHRPDTVVKASPCLTFVLTQHDTLRRATATGSLDGNEFGTRTIDPVMLNLAEGLLVVEHAPHSPQPDCPPPGT